MEEGVDVLVAAFDHDRHAQIDERAFGVNSD